MRAILSLLSSIIIITTSAAAQTCPEDCVPANVPANCPLSFDTSVYPKQYTVNGCAASVTASYGQSKTASCDANPPNGTVLIDYQAWETSSNNGGYTVSRLASGVNLDIVKSVSEDYEHAINLAVQNGDEKLAGELRQMEKSHLEMITKISTNKDTLHVDVSASGHGNDFDKKRGWEEVQSKLVVACVAPTDLADQLQVKIAKDLATAAIVINKSDDAYWMRTAIVMDKKQPCASATNQNLSLVQPSTPPWRYELKSSGQDGKLCIVFGKTKPSESDMSLSCEYTSGQSLIIDGTTSYSCLKN